ncbi:hypothetical protein EOD39_0776 [Acipenser ruthenus]|uniref:Uncharacterized protein n=1 Tax=Acipenser ruthenus TaxID=7906 RepID=A0A662Z1N9_ACIRT|nr:hypothetical protein EOD39_0776 [Acipenser ruthenus]
MSRTEEVHRITENVYKCQIKGVPGSRVSTDSSSNGIQSSSILGVTLVKSLRKRISQTEPSQASGPIAARLAEYL